jgi:class 3 adenylate cyclase
VPPGSASRTLTFLFADIRDYTAFVEQHGDARAREVIAGFRKLVRAQLSLTGGGEVKTEGDSFYLVFNTAGQALRCGIAIMNEASRQDRPGGPLPVGIGVHAGEPVPLEGQYVGSAVNIAARLGAAALAGELLISDTVRGLLRTSALPPLVERTDLQLKGVQDPPRAYAADWRKVEFESAGSDAPRARWRLGRRAFVGIGAAAVLVVATALVLGRTTATSQPPSTSTSALPSHGIALYEVDLSPLGASKVLVSSGSATSDHVTFAGDAIRFDVAPASWAAISIGGLAPDDFAAEFSIHRVSGQGSLALYFRGSSGRQDQLVVNVPTGEITVNVARSFGSDTAPERLFGPATRVPTGRDDIVLGISAKGRDLVVYLGGVEVARAVDPQVASGGIGVVVTATRIGAGVDLRTLRIYAP